MKLFNADEEPVPYAEPIPSRKPPEPQPKRPRRSKGEIPRCRCGCGKEAFWPRDAPLFYTRLCGYLMAVKMFRRKAR